MKFIEHLATSMADAELWVQRESDAAAREPLLVRLGELWALPESVDDGDEDQSAAIQAEIDKLEYQLGLG